MAKKRASKRQRKSQQKMEEEEEIQLIVSGKRCKTIEELDDEATTSEHVDRIVALLVTKKLVILQGPHGCGKTYAAKLVARRRNVPVKVLQVNDQYDSKVLFGSYNCSEVPGDFFWQPSKFAQFLQTDCVILLDNLDHGGSDLAAAIVDLADRGYAMLANGRRVQMEAQCRILGTISREEHQQHLNHISLIWRDYPFTIRMAPIQLTKIDSILAQMTKTNYELFNIRAKLLQTFTTVSALINDCKPSMDRALNVKDLFRVINRLIRCDHQNAIISDRCALFAELFDAWAAHLSGAELRHSVAAVIGEALSLSSEQQHYHMDIRFPEVSSVSENNVQFGRVKLEQRPQSENGSADAGGAHNNQFVLTRDAAQLLERVTVCVSRSPPEPVLLTGDTGVGKTATVQHIARVLRVRLHVVNLSQESEFSDLVGGHKPTSVTNILRPVVDEYINLFRNTFNAEKNQKFLDNLNNCFNAHRFADLVQLVVKSSIRALDKLATCTNEPDVSNHNNDNNCVGVTRRDSWTRLLQRARRLAKCFRHSDDDAVWRRRLLFAHVKGVLTEAAERGDWLLVDEINLAPAECMDALIELLDPSSDFTVHPDFRLFACMNSANDVGKRLLPLGIRSAFIEFFVDEPRSDDQLRLIIRGQIESMGQKLIESVLQFYIDVRTKFVGKFNLRTLTRALAVANDQLQLHHYGTAQHCLSRACAVAFISQLDTEQRNQMHQLVTHWLGAVPSIVRKAKLKGNEARKFVLIEGHKIPRGDQPPVAIDGTTNEGMEIATDNEQQTYIFTKSVRANMALLASVVSTGHFPILMEGETSAGKTSMVMQLAKMSGNRCFRINNHEHTDVQEYIGCYAPDVTGRLEFMEGVLLRAVRNGDWIVLDELNLAPSAVLEALNRLLDDNHELFVPELNTTVHAHPRFRLFATQNPVGTYAGRKRLSRAFLSRFMCLQWDALPHNELPLIVQRRCGVSAHMAQLMAQVLANLRTRRAIGGIFACSDSLMTLRDLFRWGHRMSSALADGQATNDWRQALADQGYFVLGTRCRTKQDEQAVIDALQQQLNRRIDVPRLFSADSPYMPSVSALPGLSSTIVLTAQLRRMLILCAEAWRRNEPVLLVGETGCGKTTAVHQFGDLLSINCHERTDATDLLGSIRPISVEDGGGFCWRDGIVLQAMRRGQRLLIDEISLAPDSVLERLNSLLEPQRTLLLTDAGAQSGTDDSGAGETVTAVDGFQLVATMNPGNDHGKKELSKALRNRFTEVWCSAEHDHDDLLAIVRHRLRHQCGETNDDYDGGFQLEKVAQLITKFYAFFNTNFNHLLRFSLSTRDVVTLAELFAKFYYVVRLPLPQALSHAIEANVFDALGVLPSRVSFDRQAIIDACIKLLNTLGSDLKLVMTTNEADADDGTNFVVCSDHLQQIEHNAEALVIGPFRIECCDGIESCHRRLPVGFSLNAPTPRRNALRVARALASSKPVMLEGSPGAGKSSLVVALAAATGHRLVRLNLSEQTDLYDLFGNDVPVMGSDGSVSFTWRDGPVLKAIKEGCWILLDEMNLASQSVLEGLNSCFDFRKHIYIAELDRTFVLDCSRCKFFACQNPHQQGGDRRALPKSFLNRFISIFVEEMTDVDFIYILCEFCKARQLTVNGTNKSADSHTVLPLFTEDQLAKMVLVNKLCREHVQQLKHQYGGGPFEFNLRDLFRWVEAVEKFGGNFAFGFELIYLSRLTQWEAKEKIINEVYNPVFGDPKNDNKGWLPSLPILHLSDMPNTHENRLQQQQQLNIGCVPLHCSFDVAVPSPSSASAFASPIRLLATQLGLLEHVSACVAANWLMLLSGPPHVGKRSTVRALATLVGQPLEHIRLTSETDALELLGSFEQIQNEQQVAEDEVDPNVKEITARMDSGGVNDNASIVTKSNLRFEWVDSVFVKAFRDGHWLLVEDVNCCSSAVLDCLNSCLESADGELVLPMQQQHQIRDGLQQLESKIRRHENFRIFFTMNPKNGQLSRAMRNRSVELSFGMDLDTAVGFWSANAVDVTSAMQLLPRKELTISSSSSVMALPTQSLLVAQLHHKLQRQIECPAELLCCAAQLAHYSTDFDNNKNWTEQQSFLARIELFMQVLCDFRRVNDGIDGDGCADNDSAVVVVDQSTLLGFNTFPPVTRPYAAALKNCHDELSLYNWHCWADVSSVRQHAQHADVCLQLAFLFPSSFNAQKRLWPTVSQQGFFSAINEFRQREIFSFLANNIGAVVDCAYNDHRPDLAQLLFCNTFPAEMQRWPDPCKLAVNDYEIGQKYLTALCAEVPVKCRPFRSAVELAQYRQHWSISTEGNGHNVFSLFGLLGHHFVQINQLLNRIFDDGQNAITLPWLIGADDNDGPKNVGRMFEFGRIGSTEIGPLFCNKDGSHLLFFSHLQLPLLTFGLNNCLWSRIHFDHRNNNIQHHLRLGELNNASAQLDHAFLTIWQLGLARKNVHNAANNLFCAIASQFITNTAPQPDNEQHQRHAFHLSTLTSMITKLVELLGSLTPPPRLMDPPYFAHLKQMHWRERLEQVNVYLNALQMFLQLTQAKSYGIEQLATIYCSPTSPFSSAQILREICAIHRDAINALKQLEDFEITTGGNNDEQFMYRCCWTEGQESDYTNHFQNEFVDRLGIASAHLIQAIGRFTANMAQTTLAATDGTIQLENAVVLCVDHHFKVVQQNLQNVLSTVSTLKALLTETGLTSSTGTTSGTHFPLSMPTLFVYPDLVTPYLHVLNLLSITLADVYRQIDIAMSVAHVRHRYNFSRAEFDGFFKLLHCTSQLDIFNETKNIGSDSACCAMGINADFVMHVKPFIHWVITSSDQPCPLTVPERLPICLWFIAAVGHHSKFHQFRADVLGWIIRLWESWHEQNARIQAQEQLTVVRRKRKRKQIDDEEQPNNGVDDDGEHVQMETDCQKLRSVYLPDFSNSTYDTECELANNLHSPTTHGGDAIVVGQQQLTISRDMLHDALCDLFKTLPTEEMDDAEHKNVFVSSSRPPSPPFLSLLSIMDKLELYTAATHLDDEALAYPHLLALDELRKQLKHCVPTNSKFPSNLSSSLPFSPKKSQPLNVYRDSEPSALMHCVHCLQPLHHRVQQLLAEFPENVQLATLCTTIDTFVHAAPAGAPLMKHAAQLENILVRAEEWESIADRAHSVRQPMVQLQNMLVEWRRREVHCWAGLINAMRADCAQLAVLAGWPLFKCAMDALRNEQQQQQSAGDVNTLILAFVDWMHNATVGDFDSRLWTGHLLTKCLTVLAPPNSPISATLCRRMRSTCAHFAQFTPNVQAHFAERFAPVERSLHDFCRAVRYNDLNVWSVRDSARRAHTHLVRILRSFKTLNDEPIFPLLFERSSPPLEWIPPTSSALNDASAVPLSSPLPQQNITAAHFEQQQQQQSSTCTTTLTQFGNRLEAVIVQRLNNLDSLAALRADTTAMLSELQTNIVYESVEQSTTVHKPADQDNDIQSVNEKRHGRALFVRQQQLARLVRAAAHIGLNARRAQHIDSEQLTMQTLAETDALNYLPDMIGTHFRHSTAARNLFLRQFAIFRRHASNQQQQLTPATLQQLRSIVEYTLHWMHNAIAALGGQHRFGAVHQRALHLKRCIEVEAQNFATAAASAAASEVGDAAATGAVFSAPSHACLSAVFVRNRKLIIKLCTVVERMRKLHQICPKQQQQEAIVDDDQSSPSSSAPTPLCSLLQTPLGLLRQPSTEHAELDIDLTALEHLLERLKHCNSDVQIGSVFIPNEQHHHLRIWRRNKWQTYTDCLLAVHSAFSALSLAKLRAYFVDEFAIVYSSFEQLLLNVQKQQQLPMTEEHLSASSITIKEMDLAQRQQEFDCVERAVLLYLQSIYKEIAQCINKPTGTTTIDTCEGGSPTAPLLDCVKRVLEFVNKLPSDKVLTQLNNWFHANSTVFHTTVSPTQSLMSLSNRFTIAYTLVHGLNSALGHLQQHIGTFVAQLASFHAHWSAIGCHLLTNGFVNPIPVQQRQTAETEGKRLETGDGFGDADLAPNATDISAQVENMEQIEGLKENGRDQQQRMDDEHNTNDQQQKSDQTMPEVDQPIDVEDDFAACLEGIDTGEDEGRIEDEEGVDQQREEIEDRADWNFGEVEEPEETQLDPKLWEPPAEDEGAQPEQQLREQDSNAATGDQQIDADKDECVNDINADQQQQQLADQPNDAGPDGNNEWTAGKDETTTTTAAEKDDNDEHPEHEQAGVDHENDANEGMEQQQQSENEEMPEEDDFADCLEGAGKNEERIECAEDDDGTGQQREDDEEDGVECNDRGLVDQTEETQLDDPKGPPKKNEEAQKGQQQQLREQDSNAVNANGDQQQIENDINADQQQQQLADQPNDAGPDGNNEWTVGKDETTTTTAGDNEKDDGDEHPEHEQAGVEQQQLTGQHKSHDVGADQQQGRNMADLMDDDNEQAQLFAYASSTLEQAQQTRALFDAHLRRLRHEQKHQQIAEDNAHTDIDGVGHQQRIDDDQQQQCDSTVQAQQTVQQQHDDPTEQGTTATTSSTLNIFNMMAETEQRHKALDNSDESDRSVELIANLCADFEALEQHRAHAEGDDRDDQQQLLHQLQLKWALITDSVAPLAAELAESLRAIIEPTIASRLEGDYRTGKRLNMRRLIPYIASDYRKDRIWMRRTRKARRNYQICIAVDNSQSMQHNHMTEITCNALCLIERALRQLEVGQLALCSFGSQVQLIADFAASEHDISSSVSNETTPLGVRILQQLHFDQSRTDLGQLLDVAHAMFTRARDAGTTVAVAEQLLIILGDGRGVFSEGAQRIRQTIARLSVDRVTVLFLVMDVPPPLSSSTSASGVTSSAHQSIMDMRIVDFSADGKQCTFRPYMAQFPFPLYALVRDTCSLPATVAEAVRQWFEHIATG